MAYIARLVTVAAYKNITNELKPFVDFQSNLQNVEISDEDKIAILQIETTDSYYPIFLKTNPTMKQVEEQLAKQKTKLNVDARNALLQYISEE
jgi:hypothetical protein